MHAIGIRQSVDGANPLIDQPPRLRLPPVEDRADHRAREQDGALLHDAPPIGPRLSGGVSASARGTRRQRWALCSALSGEWIQLRHPPSSPNTRTRPVPISPCHHRCGRPFHWDCGVDTATSLLQLKFAAL